jgi:hypothetical protein
LFKVLRRVQLVPTNVPGQTPAAREGVGEGVTLPETEGVEETEGDSEGDGVNDGDTVPEIDSLPDVEAETVCDSDGDSEE